MGSAFPRIAAALLLATSLSSFAGCTDAASGQSQAGVAIVESGWTSTDGYIHYGAVIENTSDEDAESTTLSITGKDAAGAVVFEEEHALGSVPAGSTRFVGNGAGNGTTPADVEFSISVDRGSWLFGAEEDGEYAIKDAMEKVGEYGGTKFVGKITRSGGESESSPVAVTVVLRNADGDIVYGSTTYIESLNNGEEEIFEVYMYETPEHASFEVHARDWQDEKD